MDEIEVFVAIRRGVAHVLPEFATRLIKALDAQPAEWFDYTPQEVIVRHRRGEAVVLGGSGVHGHGCSPRDRNVCINSFEARYFYRRGASWKNSRRSAQWRRIAMAEAQA